MCAQHADRDDLDLQQGFEAELGKIRRILPGIVRAFSAGEGGRTGKQEAEKRAREKDSEMTKTWIS